MNGSGAQPSGSHGHPHHDVDRALYTHLGAIRIVVWTCLTMIVHVCKLMQI